MEINVSDQGIPTKEQWDRVRGMAFYFGDRVAFVFNEDRELFDHDKLHGWPDTWEKWRRNCCHVCLVLAPTDHRVDCHIEPSDVILAHYEYPCEKEPCEIGYGTLANFLSLDDLYEVFKL